MAGRGFEPLRLPRAFWSRPDVNNALSARDFGSVFRLVAKYGGASQTKIAIAVGMTQGQVSTIMAGDRRVSAIDVAERALDGLDAPSSARVAYGLAPRDVAAGTERDQVDLPPPDTGDGLWTPTTDDDVERRDVFWLSGGTALGLVAGPERKRVRRLTALAHVLMPYGGSRPAASDGRPMPIRVLAGKVAGVKREYQACRYSTVVEALPSVLEAVRWASSEMDGDELVHVLRLTADAYQVAGSVTLKFGDLGLAAFAADRSMDAAARSQDPVVLAASARIVTHSLMQGGHASSAMEVASAAAERLASTMRRPTADALSVYGALLLRGAVAAALDENRGEAFRLLDEADGAATRLGRDDNAHWTAFGPTNVTQHRAHVAMVLGDAGTAVDLARRIDLGRIPIAERKAALFIDTAMALTQWGKYEQAYQALRSAEQIAPEEVRTRSSVRRLVGDLANRSPRTVRQRVNEFAEQLGVDA